MLIKQNGFSLIEAMIVLIIMASLLALSIGPLRQISQRGKATLAATQFIHVAELAQREATARHQTIVVCATDDNKTCNKKAGNHLLLYVDTDESGELRDASQVISRVENTDKTSQIHFRFYPLYQRYLTFLPSELLREYNALVWACQSKIKSPLWIIAVSRSGVVQQVELNKDGNIDDTTGKKIVC